MKNKILPLVILPLLFISFTSGPNSPSDDEAKDAIMKKIVMAADKWANGDVMGYAEVAAPDITWMDDLAAPKPVVGKEALVAYLENFKGQVPAHKKELLNFTYQFYGDIVIVTYWYQGHFGDETPPPWKVTSVYRNIDGDWLSVHENWTVVKPPESE